MVSKKQAFCKCDPLQHTPDGLISCHVPIAARAMKLRTPPAIKTLTRPPSSSSTQDELALNSADESKTSELPKVPASPPRDAQRAQSSRPSTRQTPFTFVKTKTPQRKRIPVDKYSTPQGSKTTSEQQSMTAPVRRNPRRSARKKY